MNKDKWARDVWGLASHWPGVGGKGRAGCAPLGSAGLLEHYSVSPHCALPVVCASLRGAGSNMGCWEHRGAAALCA